MSEIQAQMQLAAAARARGEHGEALRLNQSIHHAPLPEDPFERSMRLFSLFEWGLLADAFPPARAAMHVLREREAALLGAGADAAAGADIEHRFRYLVELNGYLSDPRSTLALFRQLEQRAPAAAPRVFHSAAGALLDCGAADVLQRYLPEPQEGTRYRAQYLNRIVRELAAAAENRSCIRRLAETLSFTNDLRLQCGLLKLLGKPGDAEALTETALSLIETKDTRELVRRELADPGTISGLSADWQEAQR